jgi:hypothetical protein
MAPPPPRNWADAPPYLYRGAQQQAAPAAEDQSDAKSERYSQRSLLIGGLLDWMDEDYLHSCFTSSPEVIPSHATLFLINHLLFDYPIGVPVVYTVCCPIIVLLN